MTFRMQRARHIWLNFFLVEAHTSRLLWLQVQIIGINPSLEEIVKRRRF